MITYTLFITHKRAVYDDLALNYKCIYYDTFSVINNGYVYLRLSLNLMHSQQMNLFIY